MKKRTVLLNLSLIFGVAYHVLFIAGYLLQKPLFGWLLYPNKLEWIEPVYCVSIPVIAAVFGVGFALFAVLMRKNTSRGLFVGALVFSGIAFVAERIVYSAIAGNILLLNKLTAERGELGVFAHGLGSGSVAILDTILLPVFAAAIVLMCCAGCIKEEAAENG